eukprot:m.51604 g.51604  ORF g.51604 m.51604 type:complete len:505 (-) comp7321_c0_seq1:187-1701(-)
MAEAFESLVNVLGIVHDSGGPPFSEADDHVFTGFYEQLHRGVLAHGPQLTQQKPGLAERALALILARAQRVRPMVHSATSASVSPDVALILLLVQPCVVAAMAMRGGLAASVGAVALAVLSGRPVPQPEFALMNRDLSMGGNVAALPLELRILAALALRDGCLDHTLPNADRNLGIDLLLKLTPHVGFPIPASVRLAWDPAERAAVAGHAGKDGPSHTVLNLDGQPPLPRVRPMAVPPLWDNVRPPRRPVSHPDGEAAVATAPPPPVTTAGAAATHGGVGGVHRGGRGASGHANNGTSAVSGAAVEDRGNGGDGSAGGGGQVAAAAGGQHALGDTWGLFESMWDDAGYTRIEDEADCEVDFNTIESFWTLCAEEDQLKGLPFTVKQPHKSYLGRVSGNPAAKLEGYGRVWWKCASLTDASKQWIETVLALLGEVWTADLQADAGNRVLGLEWEVRRNCTFALWLEHPVDHQPHSREATLATLSKHLAHSGVDVSLAKAYDIDFS